MEGAGGFCARKAQLFCDPGVMKWILCAVVFIALMIGLAFLIVYALPSRTTVSRSIKLQQPPEGVIVRLAASCRPVDVGPGTGFRPQPRSRARLWLRPNMLRQ